MPVRSLRSPVLRWPRREEVLDAARAWAVAEAPRHAGVLGVGVFGSCARGQGWGVGSDLDVVVVVESSDASFTRRGIAWDAHCLPVSVDLLVYTRREWEAALARGEPFVRAIDRDAVWLFGSLPRPPPAG